MTPPDPMQVRSRNRRMLLVLFLFFFGSVLLAGLLRFSGWRPEGSKNKGEMLSPYGDMRGHAPQLRDGGAYRWKDSPRTWRIAVMPRDCDGARAQACTRLLGDLDKVWQLMGKDADRVHVLWIGALPPGATVPSELRVLQPDEVLRAGLPRARSRGRKPRWRRRLAGGSVRLHRAALRSRLRSGRPADRPGPPAEDQLTR